MTCRTRLAPAVVCVAVAAMPAVSEPQPAPEVTLTRADVDPNFGQGGRVGFDVAARLGMSEVRHVRIDRLGRIVLAGSRWVPSGRTGFETPHVARLRTDGSLDATFGDGGVVEIPVRGVPQAMAVDAADRVTVTGEFRNDSGGLVAAVRLTEDGALDEEFSSDGFAEIARDPPRDGVRAPAIGGDGVVVIVERTGETFSLVRLTAAGDPDPTFGVGGTAALGSELVAGVLPDDRGGVVVVFGSWEGGPFPSTVAETSVRRIAADGVPDLAFGIGGELKWVDDYFGTVRPSSIHRDAQGRLVVLEAGYAGALLGIESDSRAKLLGRFLADGTRDNSFSEDGAMPVLVGVPRAQSVESYYLRVTQGPEDRWAVFGGVELPGGTRGWFAGFFSPSDPLSLAAHVEEARLYDVDVSSDGSVAVVAGVGPVPGGGRSTWPFVARLDLVGGKPVPLPRLEAQWRSVRVRPGSNPLDVRGTLRILNRGRGRSRPGFVNFEAAAVDPQGELVFRGMLLDPAGRRRIRSLAPGASMTLRHRAERLSGPPFGTYSLRLAAVVVPTGLEGAPEDVVLSPPLDGE